MSKKLVILQLGRFGEGNMLVDSLNASDPNHPSEFEEVYVWIKSDTPCVNTPNKLK